MQKVQPPFKHCYCLYLQYMWKQRLDKMWVGGVLGLFLPVLVYTGIYLRHYSELPPLEFIKEAIYLGLMPRVLSISLIINLASFFLFYLFKYEMAPRGIILSTMLWGAVIVYFKFLV